jgi:multicomponent Na+:H+ antiporter subunit E
VVNLVANSITLTPGTMTVEVSTAGDLDDDGAEDDVILYIHGMYTRDPEAVRRDVLHLEELALRAFGTPSDYRRAHEAFEVQDELVRRTSLTEEDLR